MHSIIHPNLVSRIIVTDTVPMLGSLAHSAFPPPLTSFASIAHDTIVSSLYDGRAVQTVAVAPCPLQSNHGSSAANDRNLKNKV